jgi:hypothetical protein
MTTFRDIDGTRMRAGDELIGVPSGNRPGFRTRVRKITLLSIWVVGTTGPESWASIGKPEQWKILTRGPSLARRAWYAVTAPVFGFFISRGWRSGSH